MEFVFGEANHQILVAHIDCSTKKVHNVVSTHTGAVSLETNFKGRPLKEAEESIYL